MARTSDARERALLTAERLFRVQGYAATGLTQILQESGAPKGSFYFHFPGGKEQLACEVLAAYGERVAAGMRRLAEETLGPDDFVRQLCMGMAREMRDSAWTLGCAAQTLAGELAGKQPRIAAILDETFRGWVEVASSVLALDGRSRRKARRQAIALIAALEGARTLARAMRSIEPFAAVAAHMTDSRPE